jgi:hypothetical protein
VEQHERDHHDGGERRGEQQVGVGHAEHVAEQEPLEARRRRGGQGEEHAEPEQGRDDHGHGGVPADRRRARRDRDGQGRDQDAGGAAEQEREARERGDDEAWQQRVGQRLGAVGEVVEDHPTAERPAGHAQQEHLEEGAPHDRLRPGVGEGVDHSSPPWWCGGTSDRAPPPGRATIAAP